MNSDFEVEFLGDYVHVLLAPGFEINPKGMEKLWIILAHDCIEYNCSRVLVEGKIFLRRMKAKDAFNSGAQAASIPQLRLVFLFYDYTTDEVSAFFKKIIASRGGAMEFFNNQAEALEWLLR